ncbi:MAG: hypothetical protein KF819_16570 [Labilithrix sp.]|nr:hypothetical protein [Labilithrix sp.]
MIVRRFVVAGVLASSLVACTPSRAPKRPTPSLVVSSGDERFGRARALVADLAAKKHASLRIQSASPQGDDTEDVELPPTREAYGLDVLVVVRVRASGVQVGKTAATTDAELVAAARKHARSDEHARGEKKAVAIVRADDEALMRDVVRAIRAMKTGGFHAVVLASVPASAEPLPDGWNGASGNCMFPDGVVNISDAANLSVHYDRDGRPTKVEIKESTSPAHAYAAAICALQKRLGPEDHAFRSGETQQMRIQSNSPYLKTPRDP